MFVCIHVMFVCLYMPGKGGARVRVHSWVAGVGSPTARRCLCVSSLLVSRWPLTCQEHIALSAPFSFDYFPLLSLSFSVESWLIILPSSCDDLEMFRGKLSEKSHTLQHTVECLVDWGVPEGKTGFCSTGT